jgi:hypothetical protein
VNDIAVTTKRMYRTRYRARASVYKAAERAILPDRQNGKANAARIANYWYLRADLASGTMAILKDNRVIVRTPPDWSRVALNTYISQMSTYTHGYKLETQGMRLKQILSAIDEWWYQYCDNPPTGAQHCMIAAEEDHNKYIEAHQKDFVLKEEKEVARKFIEEIVKLDISDTIVFSYDQIKGATGNIDDAVAHLLHLSKQSDLYEPDDIDDLVNYIGVMLGKDHDRIANFVDATLKITSRDPARSKLDELFDKKDEDQVAEEQKYEIA